MSHVPRRGGRPYGSSSGFAGKHAEIYKLSRSDFALHLAAVRRAANPGGQVILTFDDGGASAYTNIAPMLEQSGRRGYFFVTTGCIGQPGFLTADQIRELDRRGHCIGSHSCSHPRRMSRLPWEQLVLEWKVSVQCLEELVRHSVTAASVPGGEDSREVGEASAAAGIQNLFTSEPTTQPHEVNGCRVLGRYTIQRSMGPEWSGGFASGRWLPASAKLRCGKPSEPPRRWPAAPILGFRSLCSPQIGNARIWSERAQLAFFSRDFGYGEIEYELRTARLRAKP